MNSFFPAPHWSNLLIIPGLILGYTVHELAHTFFAYYLGDYTQVERGKFTLNPFRHLSWFGTVAFLLVGIGWPNPLQVSRAEFKDRPLSLGLIALAGPLASFTFGLAALLGTLFMAALLTYFSKASPNTVMGLMFPPPSGELPQTFDLPALTMAFTSKIAIASFWLAFTSAIPLPNLDGFVIAGSLLAFFQQRQNGAAAKRQSAPLVAPPNGKIVARTTPIDQYERRNNVSDIHFKVGIDYHLDNQFDDAIARYRQAIANDENFGPAYVNLGLAYLGKGKRREAIHAFRGAIQFADDQKSEQEAWYQLHQLSEVNPVADDAEDEMAELGASPWTDTRPQPNWFTLGLGLALTLAGAMALYGYLFAGLMRMLQV
jgi:Zn-dependent protease